VKLAIFDIDGTLTQTSGVDDECWLRAVRLTWGIEGVNTDWASYRHSTDEAIGSEIFETHRGRAATRKELDELRECFASLIERESIDRPERFVATPGAAEVLRALPSQGWTPAIATGGWRRTALVKLRVAGVDVEGIAAAFADDAWPRAEIIQMAAVRASVPTAAAGGPGGRDIPARHGPIDRIVYVGDGVWDVTAARARGYGFVGVAREPRSGLLRRAGAAAVLPDLSEIDRVLDALEHRSTLRRLMESRT